MSLHLQRDGPVCFTLFGRYWRTHVRPERIDGPVLRSGMVISHKVGCHMTHGLTDWVFVMLIVLCRSGLARIHQSSKRRPYN